MTITGVLVIAVGVFAALFVGCLAAEMRERTRERDALMAAGTSATVHRHAMPWRTEASAAVAAAVLLLAAVAELITGSLQGVDA